MTLLIDFLEGSHWNISFINSHQSMKGRVHQKKFLGAFCWLWIWKGGLHRHRHLAVVASRFGGWRPQLTRDPPEEEDERGCFQKKRKTTGPSLKCGNATAWNKNDGRTQKERQTCEGRFFFFFHLTQLITTAAAVVPGHFPWTFPCSHLAALVRLFAAPSVKQLNIWAKQKKKTDRKWWWLPRPPVHASFSKRHDESHAAIRLAPAYREDTPLRPQMP